MDKKLLGAFVIIAVLTGGCAKTKTDDMVVEMPKPEELVEETAADKEHEEEAENLFARMPKSFLFSSGAGGWRTEIVLSEDGSFEGNYGDSEMGESGEGYPHGTVYACAFRGKFSEPVKVNDFIYECRVESLIWDRSKTEEILDEVRYVYTEPFGLSASAKIRIYLPGTPIAEVADGFMEWSSIHSEKRKYLPEGFYGIYHVDEEQGFVGVNDDCLWSCRYRAKLKDVEISLAPGYSESYLHFERDGEFYSLCFDWYDDNGTDFEATDYAREDVYHLHLTLSEDNTRLHMILKSENGASLEPWGGTAEGELDVEMEKE